MNYSLVHKQNVDTGKQMGKESAHVSATVSLNTSMQFVTSLYHSHAHTALLLSSGLGKEHKMFYQVTCGAWKR